MQIEIRSGDDWTVILIDGKEFYEGQGPGISELVVAALLRTIPGVEVSEPDGDFCEGCNRWSVGEGVCPFCEAEEEAEEIP